MTDGMTQAIFGDEAARRYEPKSQTSPAASAFDRLVQAGATSSMVDIDGVKQGQAQQAVDSMGARDMQVRNVRNEEMQRIQELEQNRAQFNKEVEEKQQELEEKRLKVNQACDEQIAESQERMQGYGVMGI